VKKKRKKKTKKIKKWQGVRKGGSKTINKFDIEIVDRQIIQAPINSAFVGVTMQTGKIQIWALVDKAEKTKEAVQIIINGTGWIFDEGKYEYDHVGEFQLEDCDQIYYVLARQPVEVIKSKPSKHLLLMV